MKKLMFVAVLLFACCVFSSCDRKSGRRSAPTTTDTAKAVQVNLLADSAVDNTIMPYLDGTTNLHNSMDVIAYPWHNGSRGYDQLYDNKKTGLSTPEQKIVAYQIENAATMKDLFYSLPIENEWKWLTQSQIIEFCSSNRNFIRNAKNEIVFFCKRDENKILYERNLEEEMFSVIVVPDLGGETRMVLRRMWHDSPIGGCTVICPKNEVRVIKY